MNHRNDPHLTKTTQSIRFALLALWAAGIVGLETRPLLAQAQKAPPRAVPQKFEDVTLTTKDGVFLQCTYYHGPESKQTVPLILLHDWDGQGGELRPLAQYLQRLRHAVIVPDLRGHGKSLQAQGIEEPIDRAKLRRPQIEAMILDVEAVKTFLLGENNDGKLNIEQLGVVGTGFGGLLALNWAVRD